MGSKEYKFVKVTTTSVYLVPTYMDLESTLKEWFEEYPLDKWHATRDTSRFGNLTQVKKVEALAGQEALDEYARQQSQQSPKGSGPEIP